MIYDSLDDAKNAVRSFLDEMDALEERFGITSECEDSCCQMFYTVQYRNENGDVCEYTR